MWRMPISSGWETDQACRFASGGHQCPVRTVSGRRVCRRVPETAPLTTESKGIRQHAERLPRKKAPPMKARKITIQKISTVVEMIENFVGCMCHMIFLHAP